MPNPNLIFVAVQCAQVRHAAATCVSALLDGGANRQYLAISELRDTLPSRVPRLGRAPPPRAFTTLSSSLGELCVTLHAALGAAVAPAVDPPATVRSPTRPPRPPSLGLCFLCWVWRHET